MRDHGPSDSLRRSLGVFGLIVLPVGLFWAFVGLAYGDHSLAAVGLVAVGFGLLLLLEAQAAVTRSASSVATRVAVATQITAVLAVTAEPAIGVAIAVGSLIPIALALPYVDRRTLTRLMLVSVGVGVFAVAAPTAIPWGSVLGPPLKDVLPSTTLVVVYVLFQLFLWNANSRLTATASELGQVVDMSHDLASTLDPKDVGTRLARHIASVAGATDCALSMWDRDGDRVVTFGYYPPEQRERIEPAYDLAKFPATRAVLQSQRGCVIEVEDKAADPAEIAYLRSIDRRSSVMLPLVVRGEAIGIVEMTSTRSRAFDRRQVELAHFLAREAAVTFDNARLYEEIRQQAARDPLTGLANRSRFQDRAEHALNRVRGRSPNQVALLYFDLDHFKHINDKFGHAQGDRILQVVADRLRTEIRPGDTAARLGGDEFAVLLEDVEGTEVPLAVADRVLTSLARPIDLGPVSPVVRASIGVALSTADTASSDALLRHADLAMYAAKSAGRSQTVVFRSDLLELAAARDKLAALLRGAETRHELQLHYQPIVELEGGATIGVEALVRWQPTGHLLHMPAEFIGLAEETGEILSIGRWVLLEACRRVHEWQTRLRRPDLRVFVNLSARQFRDPGLVWLVREALMGSGLPAESLALEVTEGVLLTHTPDALDRLAELRALGVKLAVDDFGTGYSSLEYLHAFQIDVLKIDRAFVPGEHGIGDAHVLSQAIVEVGRALSLEMVAEGIETEDQADWFRSLGCRYGQGFLFAHPLPADELERYLRRERPVSASRGVRAATRGTTRAASTRHPALGSTRRPTRDATAPDHAIEIVGNEPRRRTAVGITDVLGSRRASSQPARRTPATG